MLFDDGLWGASEYVSTQTTSMHMKADLARLGCFNAEEKCFWFPSQTNTWLGCDWNLETGHVSIIPERMEKLHDSLNRMLQGIVQRQDCFVVQGH